MYSVECYRGYWISFHQLVGIDFGESRVGVGNLRPEGHMRPAELEEMVLIAAHKIDALPPF